MSASATESLAGTAVPDRCPYLPDNEQAYRRWREHKLDGYPTDAAALVVPLADLASPTPAEVEALRAVCRKTNMVIYAGPANDSADRAKVHALARHMGLSRLDPNMLADDDGLTSLEVVADKSGRGYIPYSNRRLLWHTDGYYNPPARHVRAFVLHCVRPADEGGENALLDPEIAFIRLRDADPDYIRALMAPDAMTIPPNSEPGTETRAAQSGPVFSIDAAGNLHMRYTARTRSIRWKDDALTREALACLQALLEEGAAQVFRHRLAPGEGLLCNNVLHNRTAFTDDLDSGRGRLLYRARYYERIAGTDLHDSGSRTAQAGFDVADDSTQRRGDAEDNQREGFD